MALVTKDINVAYESTAQEILEKLKLQQPEICDMGRTSDELVNTFEDAVVYSVTGKGHLHFVNLFSYYGGETQFFNSDSYISLFIIVDGEIIVNVKRTKGSSSSASANVGLSLVTSPDNVIENDDKTRIRNTTSSDVKATSTADYIFEYAPPDMKPIRFESGFDVRVSKHCWQTTVPTTSYTKYELGYTLDE